MRLLSNYGPEHTKIWWFRMHRFLIFKHIILVAANGKPCNLCYCGHWLPFLANPGALLPWALSLHLAITSSLGSLVKAYSYQATSIAMCWRVNMKKNHHFILFYKLTLKCCRRKKIGVWMTLNALGSCIKWFFHPLFCVYLLGRLL